MEQLPKSLFCLVLAHSIDDVNAVERMLQEYGNEVEVCIPIALRNILETDDLPQVPFFSTDQLIKYLRFLWKHANVDLDWKLAAASEQGLIYLVAYYLARGADIHSSGEEPLMGAIQYNQVDVVNYLLDRKANITPPHRYPLEVALDRNNYSMIALLLDRKADVSDEGKYVLEAAAQDGQIAIVKMLLDRNVSVSYDALTNASRARHKDILTLLHKYVPTIN